MSTRAHIAAALAGAALAATAGAGIWLYGQAQYRAGERTARTEHERAELIAWRVEANRLAGVAADLHKTTATLRAVAPGLIEAYTRETILAPLPTDCVPGSGRLRIINDAISAANAAAGAGGAVPAHTGAD